MVRVARATPDTTASWQIPSTSYLGDILVASLKKDLSRSLYELQHFEDFEKNAVSDFEEIEKNLNINFEETEISAIFALLE